ncbi:MAG TPA: hypothetical protein VFZ59_12120 [Verrucomicrobiae bacterium]|nr:hypothetical protein [Verrucomicrobiae bacterium]
MSANLLSSSFSDGPAMFAATLVLQTVIQYLVYIVAIVLVTVVATLWVASGRVTLRQSKGRSDESRRRRPSRGWFGRSDDAGKRRRKRHRRRNPTLAETGGLPPIRTEASAPATERYEA